MNSQSPTKDIVVIETNFVRSHTPSVFDAILIALSEKYDVYLTQISIDERISQRYILHKTKYEELEGIAKTYREYADISFKKSFDDFVTDERERSLKLYQEKFGSRIINFVPDNDCFSIIIDRVYKKIPPFNPDPKSSDKGFKDTMIWLSLLQHFKINTSGAKVIFLSTDGGFTKNENILKSEFLKTTDMEIEIRPNSYYKVLLGQQEEKYDLPKCDSPSKQLNDLEKAEIRKTIHEIMEDFTSAWFAEYEDGDEYKSNRFVLRQNLTDSETEQLLNLLPKFVSDNIFVEDILASAWFGLLEIEVTDKTNVSIEIFERLNKLYAMVLGEYPDYLSKIIHAICVELNKTYQAYPVYNENELPF